MEHKIPDLPAPFLRHFPEDEKGIHEVVMEDRNTLLAHSDSSAANLEPIILKIKDIEMFMPQKNYTNAPLTNEATQIFNSLAKRALDKVNSERDRLEPELIGFFDVKNN